MKLSPAQLSELEVLAIEAARLAGEMIQSKAAENHQVLQKEGGSSVASQVVTEVDLESQRQILGHLKGSIERYELGLLTEESPDDDSRHARDHFWCIDPLDGTLAFTKGSPGYSVSIALVARDGTPLIGVVYDPTTATLYHAIAGQGARKNRQPWSGKSRNPTLPTEASAKAGPLTLMIDHSFIEQSKQAAFLKQLEAITAQVGCQGARIIDHAGAVLNACAVVERAPALYFKYPKPKPGGGSLWDFAATACLFAELGLPATDIHGQPLDLNPKGSTFMNERGTLFASGRELALAVDEVLS